MNCERRFINMIKWEERMLAAIRSANLLPTLNVLDIEFCNGENLELYVAMSKEDRSIGLSSIPYLDLDGMLFVYDQPSFNPFTMVDMGFDLDIAWYNSSGALIKSGTFKAGSSEPLFSPKPYSYVIETLAGNLPFGDLRVRNV